MKSSRRSTMKTTSTFSRGAFSLLLPSLSSPSNPSLPLHKFSFDQSANAALARRVTPDNVRSFTNVLSRFNVGDDCPIFSDMWDYSRQYAGASLMAARKLVEGTTDIAINWTGGLHHAKKAEASGFCYVNDIVLAVLELLRCVGLTFGRASAT